MDRHDLWPTENLTHVSSNVSANAARAWHDGADGLWKHTQCSRTTTPAPRPSLSASWRTIRCHPPPNAAATPPRSDAVDAERSAAKVANLERQTVESKAELDVMRERLEVTRALGRFRPEDLAGISRINTELAQAIHTILPKLGAGEAHAASASAPELSSYAASEPQLQSLGMVQ